MTRWPSRIDQDLKAHRQFYRLSICNRCGLSPLTRTLLSSQKTSNFDCSPTNSASKSHFQNALSRYRILKNSSPPISSAVFPPVLKACANLNSLDLGVALHADVIKMGFAFHTSTCNTLMSLYLKCRATRSALNLFEEMPLRDSVSWNVMIHGFFSGGASKAGLGLFKRARSLDFAPNVAVIVLAIQASWMLDDVDEGLNLHGFVIRNGIYADASVQNSLLTLYAKLGNMHSAQRVFDEIVERDVISWSSLIGGYARNGRAMAALQLFQDMSTKYAVDMDGLTAVPVLQACAFIEDIHQGTSFHGHLIRQGFEGDLFVGNSLIDMYSKCRDVHSAGIVFNSMLERNTVSWNSMISGLVHNEENWEAVKLFDSMIKAAVQIDEVTLVNMLQSCKKLDQQIWCKCIHAIVIKNHSLSNIIVLNNLLDAYAKCSCIELTLRLFERMENRNAISWSITIAGFVHIGQPDIAILFFSKMWLAGEKPNPITMLSVVEACALAAELKLSKCAHGIILRNEFSTDIAIGTAVVDMYAKCGDVNAARKVFQTIPERNIVTWNAMIGALGMNGCAQAAISVFHEMESEHVKPNEVTMLAVLSACSHGGLVQEGLSFFHRVTLDPSLHPSLEHYSCVVDMLGRAGDVEGAFGVIKRMPQGLEAGPAAWGALLSACRSHGNCEVGQDAASRILELEPLNSAGYLLTSSLYAKGGSSQEMARMRLLMKEKGVRVMSGFSSVYVDQKAHKFVSWDGSHPQSEDIYSIVELLHDSMSPDGTNDCLIT